MTTESQAAFARRLNVNRSIVTRWKEKQRLVMRGDLVDIKASLELLEETRGPRDDVAFRHHLDKVLREDQDQLERAKPEIQVLTERLRSDLRDAALKKGLAEARIKEAEADLREMERDRQAGDLLLREDVDYVLNDFGAFLRSMLDGRAERLGAELGLTPQQIVSVSESDERLLIEMADKLKGRAA